MPPLEYWMIAPITAIAVVCCVVLHYEGLRLLSKLRIGGINDRRRIIVMMLSILLLHIMEVWIFGGIYYLLLLEGGFGGFVPELPLSIIDCVYYSATVFTTLGFGDIVPTGAIRFMTGTQSVAGLTLITWSASFTFTEMMKTNGKADD